MNILLSFDFFPKIGGAHKWLYEVYKRWPTDVTSLVQDYSDDMQFANDQKFFDSNDHGRLSIERYDLLIEDINILNFLFIKKIFNIFNKLKKCIKNDTARIHCIRAFPEGIPAILVKKLSGKKIKVITYVHGEEILIAQESRQLSFIAKWVYQNSDLVIVNSRSTQRLLDSFSISGPVKMIHPGVDTKSFKIEEDRIKKFRNKFTWPEDTVILCTMARMEPRKNHIKVIQALHTLRQEGFNAAYIIGSDGGEKEYLKKIVRDLNLEEFIAFTGYLSEEERILTFLISDIHVMPSVQKGPMIEGYGIVFIEAAAAGIPSISGNIGGQPEAVLDKKTGLVVDGNDGHAIKNAIKYLIENKEVRIKMGRAGKSWAVKNDWEAIARRTYEIMTPTVLKT